MLEASLKSDRLYREMERTEKDDKHRGLGDLGKIEKQKVRR